MLIELFIQYVCIYLFVMPLCTDKFFVSALLLLRLPSLSMPFVSCLGKEPQRNEIRNKTKQNTRKTLPMYKLQKQKGMLNELKR